MIVKIDNIYLVFNNVDGCIEERNEQKYLIFGLTDKNKEGLTLGWN